MGDALAAVSLGTGRTAKHIVAGAYHNCAILDNDLVKCWGNGGLGQLGSGATANVGDSPGEMGDALAAVTLGTGRSAKHIVAGESHNCAILDNDFVKCWGYGAYGQLGSGATANVGDSPGEMGDALVAVTLGTGRTAKHIVAGWDHNCAILDNDLVKCWGLGRSQGVCPRGIIILPWGSAPCGSRLRSLRPENTT